MEYKELGDWCKFLEKNFTPEIMIPTLPVIIRLDGNNFHSWTKGLKRPFDEGLVNLMIETTKVLVKETNAIVGYSQSDEISLVLYSSDRNSSIYHDGKKQKILSKLTAKTVNTFNELRKKYLPDHDKIAVFDCRIYQVPTLNDACSQLLWRENDAIKNSKQMIGRAYFSHNQLNNLNTDQIVSKLIKEKNIDWNDLPNKYKKGTYIKRIKTIRPFTAEELASLPEKHNAKENKELKIERNFILERDYPVMNTIENKIDVIFNDLAPIIKRNK
jgi:tRNA(His) 5'-end guanylyltransferase